MVGKIEVKVKYLGDAAVLSAYDNRESRVVKG